jgi:hypothetical protein
MPIEKCHPEAIYALVADYIDIELWKLKAGIGNMISSILE